MLHKQSQHCGTKVKRDYRYWTKQIWVRRKLAEYIFFAPDEGFYCWIVGGGARNLWANILMFKFIIVNLVTQC